MTAGSSRRARAAIRDNPERGADTARSADASRAAEAAQVSVWLLIVLALPRIARIIYPEVWVEDDFYLESAYLVSLGMRPYLDFVHPHMPALEWVAGGYLRMVGASHLSLEILNETAIYATSLLTYALGRRVAGRPAAVLGAILYAYSSLVFRYHVYERECFEAPLILMAALAALRDDLPATGQSVRVAIAGALACAVKLTAAIPCAVVLAYLAIASRRWLRAIAGGLLIAAALAAFSALCYWRYGFEFVFQTFIFHFLKGRETGEDFATYPGQILDLLLPLLILGVVAIISGRARRRGIALVLAMVAVEYAFFGFISPTAWAHNYLEVLPFIAIVAGVGFQYVIDAGREVFGPQRGRTAWIRLLGGVAFTAGLFFWLTPNENWLHGAVYGFGFIPRDEIRQMAAALRSATKPDDEVIAPSFIAFEANRRQLIRFPETYGVYRQARAEYDKDGFRAARAHLGRADFYELIDQTAHFWTDPIKRAIGSGRVTAVVPDSPVQLVPFVLLSPEFLVQNGFRPAMRTDHFTLWQRIAPAPSGAPPKPSR